MSAHETKHALRPFSEHAVVSVRDSSGSTEYSMRDFLTTLFKRRRAIVVFFTAVMVTVALGLLLKRPTYEVTAAILVKKARTEMPLTPSSTSEPIVMMVSEEDLNSEIEILKSRGLIEDALKVLSGPVSEPPSSWAQFKSAVKRGLGGRSLSPLDQRVLDVEQQLKFSALARSNIIELRYRFGDPVWATDFVRTLIDTYLERRIEVHQLPQAVSFFDEQTEAARARLTAAEGALESYTVEAGVSTPLDDQKLLALQAVDQFEREHAEATVAVQEGESRVAALQGRLRGVPERLPSANRFNQNVETEELRKALVDLKLRRDDLLTRGFSSNNVRVRDLTAQIGLAESRLTEAESQVGDLNRTEVNVVHQGLKAQLLAAQADLAAGTARVTSLRRRLARFQRSLDEVSHNGFELTRLNREVTAAEDAYLLYRKKHEEAQIAIAMDQQKMVNVGVAREPRPPLTPVGPSKMMALFLALTLASIGAMAVAFALEYLDHTFTTGDDVERRLGIVHVASIPEEGALARS